MINVTIPYDDFARMQTDSADKASVKALLETEFPDDTCQIKAIKAILGVEEKEVEPTDPVDPIDPDPTDPSDPGSTDPDPTDP